MFDWHSGAALLDYLLFKELSALSLLVDWGLTGRSLHVLPAPVWVYSGRFGLHSTDQRCRLGHLASLNFPQIWLFIYLLALQ